MMYFPLALAKINRDSATEKVSFKVARAGENTQISLSDVLRNR